MTEETGLVEMTKRQSWGALAPPALGSASAGAQVSVLPEAASSGPRFLPFPANPRAAVQVLGTPCARPPFWEAQPGAGVNGHPKCRGCEDLQPPGIQAPRPALASSTAAGPKGAFPGRAAASQGRAEAHLF